MAYGHFVRRNGVYCISSIAEGDYEILAQNWGDYLREGDNSKKVIFSSIAF